MRILQLFLHLIDAHFPKEHTFKKIFSKNLSDLQLHPKRQGNHKQAQHGHSPQKIQNQR